MAKTRGRPKGSKNKAPKAAKRKPVSAPPASSIPEVQMPVGEEAEQVLVSLAEIQDRIKLAEAREADCKAAYQEAKSDREALDQELKDKLWKATHKAELPLFDQQQAEADLRRMEAQVEAQSALEPEPGPEVPPLALPDEQEGAGDVPTDDQVF